MKVYVVIQPYIYDPVKLITTSKIMAEKVKKILEAILEDPFVIIQEEDLVDPIEVKNNDR